MLSAQYCLVILNQNKVFFVVCCCCFMMFKMFPPFQQALALVSNSIQRDGCAVENLKIDVSQVSTKSYLTCQGFH